MVKPLLYYAFFGISSWKLMEAQIYRKTPFILTTKLVMNKLGFYRKWHIIIFGLVCLSSCLTTRKCWMQLMAADEIFFQGFSGYINSAVLETPQLWAANPFILYCMSRKQWPDLIYPWYLYNISNISTMF